MMVLTAALSNIKLDWVNGLKWESVSNITLPPGKAIDRTTHANIGSWRAHMDAISKCVSLNLNLLPYFVHIESDKFYSVVEQNLSTALILEDDADWDVRIKSQLRDFAFASRALVQPVTVKPISFADPTYPSPEGSTFMPPDIYFHNLPSTVAPTSSPYGDGWDILWLGHCGTRFPTSEIEARAATSGNIPKGRVVLLNDPTVPEHDYLADLLSKDDDPRSKYPQHTRVVHHAMGSQCSLAYAISQAGARKLLYEMGIKSFSREYDLMLQDLCQGTNDREILNCITVQPQLLNHHRPAGNPNDYSDITDHSADEVRDFGLTENIQWSAKLNFRKLLHGKTDFQDQFPNKLT